MIRHWVFTLWDAPPLRNGGEREPLAPLLHSTSRDLVAAALNEWRNCLPSTYTIAQLEVCPSTERLHLQCYAELSRSIRWSTLKRALPQSAHIEARRGLRSSARGYCMPAKNGPIEIEDSVVAGPFETGVWRHDSECQRNQTPREQAVEMILNGAHPREVAFALPGAFATHYRGLYALYHALNGRNPSGSNPDSK
jgi:hypothetical protein